MKTTVTIDIDLVTELMAHYRAKTKTAAVTAALQDQVRLSRLRQLADLLGSVQLDLGVVSEADALDLRRASWIEEMGSPDGR